MLGGGRGVVSLLLFRAIDQSIVRVQSDRHGRSDCCSVALQIPSQGRLRLVRVRGACRTIEPWLLMQRVGCLPYHFGSRQLAWLPPLTFDSGAAMKDGRALVIHQPSEEPANLEVWFIFAVLSLTLITLICSYRWVRQDLSITVTTPEPEAQSPLKVTTSDITLPSGAVVKVRQATPRKKQ